MGLAARLTQLAAVESKEGCTLLQWAIQMVLEAKPKLAAVSLDIVNAYGEIERECIEVAIKSNPYLHILM